MNARDLFLKLRPADASPEALHAARRALRDVEVEVHGEAEDRARAAKTRRDRLLIDGPMEDLLAADAELQAARADLERIDAMRKHLNDRDGGGGTLTRGFLNSGDKAAAGKLCM